jgi:hypothetical protein
MIGWSEGEGSNLGRRAATLAEIEGRPAAWGEGWVVGWIKSSGDAPLKRARRRVDCAER